LMRSWVDFAVLITLSMSLRWDFNLTRCITKPSYSPLSDTVDSGETSTCCRMDSTSSRDLGKVGKAICQFHYYVFIEAEAWVMASGRCKWRLFG
jgi:hypothetical protein